MSSNIEVQKICKHCGKEFTARTTVTKYCSHRCASLANKAKIRAEKLGAINTETKLAKFKPIDELKAKEFLTVRDVATLLNSSLRTVYRLIEQGNIKAVNLAERKTLVKRSDIDKLFSEPTKPQPESNPEPVKYDISDCYTLTEVQEKYGISEKALYDLIIRNSIPKIKKSRYAYVPKEIIDRYLS